MKISREPTLKIQKQVKAQQKKRFIKGIKGLVKLAKKHGDITLSRSQMTEIFNIQMSPEDVKTIASALITEHIIFIMASRNSFALYNVDQIAEKTVSDSTIKKYIPHTYEDLDDDTDDDEDLEDYGLIEVGFFREIADGDSNYPSLKSSISQNLMLPATKRKIVKFLQSGEVKNYSKGWSTCRICGIKNGTTDLTDGIYIWPSGYAHYVEKHNVIPPKHFIKHVLRTNYVLPEIIKKRKLK